MMKTEEIDKKIHNILLKPRSEKLEENDLIKVKKIVLNKTNLKGEEIEYNFCDLSLLTELESLSIDELLINDDFIKNINTLKLLKNLTINDCRIVSKNFIKTNLNMLIITNCESNILDIFENIDEIKTLELIDIGTIDLKKISKLKNLKRLYIRNCNIANFDEIKEFKYLEKLNLDGSKVDNEEVLDYIKDKVDFQMEDSYMPVE